MDYRNTLNLPKTEFPMRANLAKREPEFLKKWEAKQIYKTLIQQAKERAKYILHDGPPYANGNIHIGSAALNKILKDIIVKSKFMAGFNSHYVPGWDCHGLPVEHEVEKSLGKKKTELSTVDIRRLCRDYATKYINIQRDVLHVAHAGVYTLGGYVGLATFRAVGDFWVSLIVTMWHAVWRAY